MRIGIKMTGIYRRRKNSYIYMSLYIYIYAYTRWCFIQLSFNSTSTSTLFFSRLISNARRMNSCCCDFRKYIEQFWGSNCFSRFCIMIQLNKDNFSHSSIKYSQDREVKHHAKGDGVCQNVSNSYSVYLIPETEDSYYLDQEMQNKHQLNVNSELWVASTHLARIQMYLCIVNLMRSAHFLQTYIHHPRTYK